MNHVFLLVGMLSMTFVSCESDQRTENPTGKLDEGSSSESNEETILEEPGSNLETFEIERIEKEDPSTTVNPPQQQAKDPNSNLRSTPATPNSGISTMDTQGGTEVINPFAGGFEGGEGGGSTPGPIYGSGRAVLYHVNSDDIQLDYDVKFYFKPAINAEGYVVDILNIKSKTTTVDEATIRRVASLVKSQVRYSKLPGAAIQTLQYVVNYKAV